MGRRKLDRFADNEQNPLIVQPGKARYENLRGCWHRDFFGNEKPIALEIGCGKGEYTVGLAAAYPGWNFIGVDIKGARIWKGATRALNAEMQNVGFLRTFIQNIDRFFAEDEVAEIWITFPDPRPRKRDAKRRLTHPRFLQMYHRMLQPGGRVHLKTDNTGLFDYSRQVVETLPGWDYDFTYDLYQSPLAELHMGIETHYEQLWREAGRTIKYLRFRFPEAPRYLERYPIEEA